ncbi:MAG TPA: SulP family inorganic anion transporter [Nitrospirota bacterium]|nr:SulP family inorganic anion transporter [Nitrospirota bacterium]
MNYDATSDNPTQVRDRLLKIFPFLGWHNLLTKRNLRADFIAGLTGAVIVLPQGVAFAIIAGLPPEYGLYAAIVPTIIAALFGSSMHLISGPTTAISIVVFTTVSPLAEPASAQYIEMVLAITFLAGLFQFALGLARMGALVNFVSHSVVIGFTAGAAVLIATSQIANLFGLPGSKRHAFIHIWIDFFRSLPEMNVYALIIGICSLAAAVLFKIYAPRKPGMLFAMIAASLLALALHGKEHGVRLIGSLPSRLPPFSLPDVSTASVRRLAPAALAISMLGLAEAVSIARSVATRSHQRIDSNQEFIGQGLSNLIGSFFSSYAASGSFTRSGVNYEAGAQTPMAAVFAALLLTAILLLIAPLTAYLPIPAMAAVLLVVAYGLVDMRNITTIAKTSKQEAVVLLITFLATLLVELEFAIYIGVMLSLLLYLNRTSHPNFVTLVPDPASDRRSFVNIEKLPSPECPQMKMVRIDGSLFFGAVDHFAESLHDITKTNPEQAHILVVGGGINFIDVAGCEMLADEARNLHLSGRKLYLCSMKSDVLDMLGRGGYLDRLGEENVFLSKRDAVKKMVLTRLDPERCRPCMARIFNECRLMPAAEPKPSIFFQNPPLPTLLK